LCLKDKCEELNDSSVVRRLPNSAGEDGSWKTEWKHLLNRLALSESVLADEELKLIIGRLLFDFVMDFKYLNILLLSVETKLLTR